MNPTDSMMFFKSKKIRERQEQKMNHFSSGKVAERAKVVLIVFKVAK